MTGLLNRILAVVLMATFAPSLAHAALLAPAPEAAAPAEAEAPIGPIETVPDAGDDERIETRIGQIFSQIPAFESVDVSVDEGVVKLSGTVSEDSDVTRAETLAAQVEGVATVENGVERDVSLSSGLSFFERFEKRLGDFIKLLPLIGLALVVATGIALVGYAISSLTWLWRKIAPNVFLADLIASAIRFVFVVGGIVVALDMIGAGTLLGAILGGAGVIGLAFGFALRETIENYLASLMLSLRQPFRANDLVLIDGIEGRVIRLTSRATIIMTLDGNHVRIPNAQVFKAVITNFTRNPQRRLEVDMIFDAGGQEAAVREAGLNTLADLPFVLTQPPPEVRIIGTAAADTHFRFLGWIDQRNTDRHKGKSQIVAAMMSAMKACGFAMPENEQILKFSPDSPLVIQDGDSPVIPKAPAPPKADPAEIPPSPTLDTDTRPENYIAQMVEDEREAVPNDGDLLDGDRPVE